jgi:hypothetical protein
MTFRSALLLSAVCCPLWAGAAPAGELLTVLVGSDHATPAVLQAMEHAAEAALAPGIQLTWTTTQQLQGTAVSAPLAVIRLSGDCRPGGDAQARPAARLPEGEPLGRTYISDGQVLSTADILCDNVRALVAPDLRGVPMHERDALLGRALGRVLAHELYHIVLRTALHSADGLSRPRQSSADLLAFHDSFAEPASRSLAQSAFTSPPLEPGP